MKPIHKLTTPKNYNVLETLSDISRWFEPLSLDMTESNQTSGLFFDWVPSINIKETTNHYVITADVPGVEPKNITVDVENNVLTIKGRKEIRTEEDEKDFLRIERASGTFMRRLALPETVDATRVDATCKNGVLEITVPKLKQASAHKITVRG